MISLFLSAQVSSISLTYLSVSFWVSSSSFFWSSSVSSPAFFMAIQTSEIGINPIDDGQVIRLVFPAPTEERRKQLTKEVQKQGEEAKVAVRNVRRDAMDKFKAMKKAGELTEDDQKKLEEETQKLTDKYVKQIDETCAAKNKEIMEV